MEHIDIAVGFDNNYIMQYGIAMLSASVSTDAQITFHAILSGDVSDEGKSQLSQLLNKFNNEILYYPLDSHIFSDMPETAHVNKASYNRLMIPSMLSEDIHRVLYLDGDLIVCQSLLPLWHLDMNGAPLSAAFDSRSASVHLHNSIDIPLAQTYYNAGVLLFDLDAWRTDDIAQQCIDYIRESQCLWMDQDAINHVIGHRVQRLHLKYNFQIYFRLHNESEWCVEKQSCFNEVHEAMEAPVIIHYSEMMKPWHKGYKMPEEWLKYKLLSPWKDVPLYDFQDDEVKIPQMTEALEFDTWEFRKNAPAYFMVFQKTVHDHRRLYKIISKILWFLVKIL